MQEIIKKITKKYLKIKKIEEKKEIKEYIENKKELEMLINELKDIIKIKKKDYENKFFKVDYIEKYKRYYDYSKIKKIANKEELALIDSIIKIPTKDIEELAKNALISTKILQKAYTEEPNGSSVYFKFKK